MSSVSSGTSTSQSTSNSTSTSTPSVAPVNLQIAAMLQQLSGTAEAQGNETYKWANDQFAKSSVVTDQMVNDANTYSSQARIGSEMGKAETDTGQAMDASRVNSEEQLRSYGVDPSSGRYAALDRAANTQKAAAQAGAGQVARQKTEDTGRQLRAQAINAEMANQNTGAAMKGAANAFMSTAAAAGKYAPTQQTTNSTSNSQSTSQQQNSSHSTDPSQPSRSSGGGSGGGTTPNGSGDNSGGGSGYQSGNGSGGYNNTDPSTVQGNQPDARTMSTQGNPDFAAAWDTSSDPYSTGSGIDSSGDQTWSSGGGDYSGGSSDYSSQNDNAYAFAQGGGVPDDQTTGGQVPQSASPSQGMQTDDVPAQLNAEEFVVPRDVARWKGEEFFQKLIDQSRKARVMGSAKGKPGAAAPQGAPAFASQAMGA